MDCNKVQHDTRKLKKKHVNNEVDRMKQAEKKKRRLEKALATSAAIRSELEKKKQKKKEEQQRLDEEGAAIAEAVALQVLLEDDSNNFDSGTQEGEGLNRWELGNKFNLFTTGNLEMPRQNTSQYSVTSPILINAQGYLQRIAQVAKELPRRERGKNMPRLSWHKRII